MDDRYDLSTSTRLRRITATTAITDRLAWVATCTALLLGALACDAPTRPAIDRRALVSAHSRAGARSAMEWTTELGTFTLLPTPDSSIYAYVHGISPNGDSTMGVTWTQIGHPPYTDMAYEVGFNSANLSYVYRAGFPTWGKAINDAGDVVGVYFDSAVVGNPQHAFLFHEGAYSEIVFPGSMTTGANGINNSGTVVGGYTMPDGAHHGFTYADGAFTSFDLPDSFGACNSSAVAINSHGTIVGFYRVSQLPLLCGSARDQGYIRDSDGTFTAFDATAHATLTRAFGINDQGDIVGRYHTMDGKDHGFLRRGNGEPTITVDFPTGAPVTQLNGIDRSGRIIVGNVFAAGPNSGRPFKLTLCDSGDHNQQQQGRNRVGTHGGPDEQCGNQDQAATRSRD
ncbi:MAG TPA: DUF3466 family protein [Gemmatimonadaceae bacterium]|nr:DUF3466 family protein [Gemmatimonadaceae bacterium]